VDGNEENPELPTDRSCGVSAGVPGVQFWGDGVVVGREWSSLPIFFNQPRIKGSFPFTQPTSTPSNPRSFCPLADTAENASRICLKGTKAVPVLGRLSAFFFGALRERTMDSVSTLPKPDNRLAIDSGVVSSGCVFKEYFSRIVVSRGSENC
jgi:hypothetical protein